MKTLKIKDDAKTPTSELLAKCKDKFKVWSIWDDTELDKLFPIPKEPTTREFAKVQEAEDFAGKSTQDLVNEGLAKECCTLRERLIMELVYFEKTGNHLDENVITFCAGSPLPGGGVPYVYFTRHDGTVDVSYDGVQKANDDLRFRRAVSLSPSETSGIYALNERVAKLEEQMKKISEATK